MNVTKLNESYSVIDAPQELLMEINDFLKVERPGAYFDQMVKSGFKSPYDYFTTIQNGKLLVMNGHLALLNKFGIVTHKFEPEYTEEYLTEWLNNKLSILPFPPRDFQEAMFKETILTGKLICRASTSSGKSFSISLIAEFFKDHGKRGLLLVPNINLLSQFHEDIKDYNLIELYEGTHKIGGGSNDRNFDNYLTISTWQSLTESAKFMKYSETEPKSKNKKLVKSSRDYHFKKVTENGVTTITRVKRK